MWHRMFLVNSPIVRGDNLRFREAGVKEVVSRVLLPWLNSFRFFLGQVALLKKKQPASTSNTTPTHLYPTSWTGGSSLVVSR